MKLRTRPVSSAKLLASLVPVALAGLAAGCGGESPPPAMPPPPPPATAAPAASEAPKAAAPAHPAFENPGGMWMPEQLASQMDTLRGLGLELDPKVLTDPSSDLLQAIVSLGGCSASFVSEDGLIVTNHHCATDALQYNATPKENLLKDGFLARTRAEEKWNGPAARVFVTQAMRDVTQEVRAGLTTMKDDTARHKAVEDRTKALISACEKGRAGLRCSVSELFGGGQYRLIEQLEVRDVRLVFAPHEGVGNFGGETDNWRWPRHAGDVTFYRAYVGKDGKPADYAADNVPYKSTRHLKLASRPLKGGDLVFVAGYPGTTDRLRTSLEVEDAAAWRYPHSIAFLEENVALLEKLSKTSAELAIKARPLIRGLNNALTNYRGVLEGLEKGGLAADKKQMDLDLAQWVAAEPARKAELGDVLPKIADVLAGARKTREADAAIRETARVVSMLSSADTLVRMAEERPKADAARDPAFQERNWTRMEQREQAKQKRYDRVLDKALFKLALTRAARLPVAERPAVLAAVVGAGEPTAARIDKAVDALYAGTRLEDDALRVKLFRTAKLEDLKRSKDTLVQLALKLRPAEKASEDRDDARHGAFLLLRPRYVGMLEAMKGAPLAPDANGTLRVTYGTVRGYKPRPAAPEYQPFTRLSEMVKKATGDGEFQAPGQVLEAIKAKRFGDYVDADLGEVPVDFLSDLDITGGNSGSATLNARGELVGLAFDGNYESVASDWLFMPKVTRAIHVDIRYVEWLLDAAYGGKGLLEEMGAHPTVR